MIDADFLKAPCVNYTPHNHSEAPTKVIPLLGNAALGLRRIASDITTSLSRLFLCRQAAHLYLAHHPSTQSQLYVVVVIVVVCANIIVEHNNNNNNIQFNSAAAAAAADEWSNKTDRSGRCLSLFAIVHAISISGRT